MTEPVIKIVEADLSRPDHQETVLNLVNAYACDPMGDGKPLSDAARRNLIPGLKQHPTTLVLMAFKGEEPVGIAVCFRGFSTFAARPLLNIHDFFVAPVHRGTGISRRLMAAVEQRGRELGCCKLTLEVVDSNQRARGVYAAAGFQEAAYHPKTVSARFLAKPL
jgi:GNAT superfamily N-acetyltransferase